MRAFFVLVALGAAPLAVGQLALDRGLESLPLSWDGSDSISLWGAFDYGLVSRQGEHVSSLYEERLAGLRLSRRLGRWRVLGEISQGSGGGHDDGSSAQGRVFENDLRVLGSYDLGRGWEVKAGVKEMDYDLRLDSDLLGTSLDALGPNPPIFSSETQVGFPVGVAWSQGRVSVDATVEPLKGHGSISAGDPGILSVPIAPSGISLDLEGSLRWGRDTFRAWGGFENADGSGNPVAPGTSAATSVYSQTSRKVGGSVERDWGRRGRVELRYENAWSHEGFAAFDPDGQGLDSSLPPGTTLTASGDLTLRRSEIGAEWRSPSDQWRVSYRQLWAPFSLRGAYAATISIVTLSNSGDISYTKANLGALMAAYSTPISRAKLTIGVQQLLPYLLERAAGSSGSGSATAGSSRSFGGTSVGLEISIPLG